jgi:hypothetical protein
MTEAPPVAPAPETEAPKPKRGQRLLQGVVAVALLISGLLGMMRGYNSLFVLPGCAADTTSATLKNIFQSKSVELSKVGDAATVSDSSSERTCEAHIETPDEKAIITYRIYWDGWSPTVMITEVKAE